MLYAQRVLETSILLGLPMDNTETPVFPICFTQCLNPLCEDFGIDREVVTSADSWWCWCGSRMQPPACASSDLLTAWTTQTGLEIHDYGACAGHYHAPEIDSTIEGPPE